jgi:hypothetical protein
MHEVLFPLGPRQLNVLSELAPGQHPRATLMKLQGSVVQAVRRRVSDAGVSGEVLSWMMLDDEAVAAGFLAQLAAETRPAGSFIEEIKSRWTGETFIGDIYCAALAPELRHRLGEYYTPRELVKKITAEAHGGIVADPACGDGRFLVELLRRGHDPAELWGCDVNPIAVMMARYEVWRELGKSDSVPAVELFWGDFLVSPETAPSGGWARYAGDQAADHFIGNPPWILWRNTGDEYRNAIAAKFKNTHLNHASGWAARVSAGQTDLSHLFIHEAVERVGERGHVSFVLPLSTFKAAIGASLVRSGRTASGRSFSYIKVLDYSKAEIFTEVRGDTTIALIEVDETQRFPVRWELITERAGSGSVQLASPSDHDDPTSPWCDRGNQYRLHPAQRRAVLKARGGINTGGGNGIFHVDLLGPSGEGLVLVRNKPSRGFPSRIVEMPVEAAYVRPLIRGREVHRWHCSTSSGIVLPHRLDDLRKPVPKNELSTSAPRLFAFLAEFRNELSDRKELARWGGEWYSLFRIGPYTAGCWRVIWPTSAGKRLRSLVLSPTDRTVPDQKVVLVPFGESLPAYFLCALLNSSVVKEIVAGGSGMDTSPNLTQRLPLPHWDPESPVHQELAKIAEQAHLTRNCDDRRLDHLVGSLYM